MKRHNARVAEDHYNVTQSAVAEAFREGARADRMIGIAPTIKSHDDLIAFAKEGSPILATLPAPKRPALRLV
jgi:hypothetical protein